MNTQLLQKSYEYYVIVSALVEHFPKKDRHALGIRIENATLCLIEEILLAEQAPDVLRDHILLEASVKNAMIKLLVRIAQEKKLIAATNYFRLSGMSEEMG